MTPIVQPLLAPAAQAPPAPYDLLDQALDADLSPCAFTLFAAIVLRDAAADWASCSTLATAGRLTNYQARRPLAELVRGGLLDRRRTRGRRSPDLSETTLIDYRIPAKGAAR